MHECIMHHPPIKIYKVKIVPYTRSHHADIHNKNLIFTQRYFTFTFTYFFISHPLRLLTSSNSQNMFAVQQNYPRLLYLQQIIFVDMTTTRNGFYVSIPNTQFLSLGLEQRIHYYLLPLCISVYLSYEYNKHFCFQKNSIYIYQKYFSRHLLGIFLIIDDPLGMIIILVVNALRAQSKIILICGVLVGLKV